MLLRRGEEKTEVAGVVLKVGAVSLGFGKPKLKEGAVVDKAAAGMVVDGTLPPSCGGPKTFCS